MSSRKDPVFSQGAGHKILDAADSLQSQTKVRFHQIFWLLERMECFCLFLSDLMCPRDPPCEEEEYFEKINAVLPEEVLLRIFSFLSPSDLKASMLVCKLWTQVGQAPSLWRMGHSYCWWNFPAGPVEPCETAICQWAANKSRGGCDARADASNQQALWPEKSWVWFQRRPFQCQSWAVY